MAQGYSLDMFNCSLDLVGWHAFRLGSGTCLGWAMVWLDCAAGGGAHEMGSSSPSAGATTWPPPGRLRRRGGSGGGVGWQGCGVVCGTCRVPACLPAWPIGAPAWSPSSTDLTCDLHRPALT